MQITVEMRLTKETKNTVRYDDPNPIEASRAALDCIYIKKRALPQPFPSTVKITVEV